jgi:DNA mismatch repair protein MutS
VKPGPASQSYGLHVAELAGVPRDVVERARDYLRRLEEHQQTLLPASPQVELALGQAAGSAPTPAQRSVLDKLDRLDVDSLSPRAALEVLYGLRKELE